MADTLIIYSGKVLSIPEILDMILKLLKDDEEKTLKTCSQVARLWRDTSQPYFFSHVVVKATLQDQHCQEFDMFLNFLEKSSRVRSYIRTVHLHGIGVSSKREKVTAPAVKVYLSVIRSIIRLLPSGLDKIHISNLCLVKDRSYVRESGADFHRPITRLFLEEISVPTFSYGFGECMEVIRLFTSIYSLVLSDLPIGADGLTSRKRKLVAVESPVSVSHISVRSRHHYGRQVQFPELLGSLLQTIHFPAVLSLWLGYLSKEGIRSQELVLQEAKQHGRRVYLGLSHAGIVKKQIVKAARAQPNKVWSLKEMSRFVSSRKRQKLPILLHMENPAKYGEYLELSA